MSWSWTSVCTCFSPVECGFFSSLAQTCLQSSPLIFCSFFFTLAPLYFSNVFLFSTWTSCDKHSALCGSWQTPPADWHCGLWLSVVVLLRQTTASVCVCVCAHLSVSHSEPQFPEVTWRAAALAKLHCVRNKSLGSRGIVWGWVIQTGNVFFSHCPYVCNRKSEWGIFDMGNSNGKTVDEHRTFLGILRHCRQHFMPGLSLLCWFLSFFFLIHWQPQCEDKAEDHSEISRGAEWQ